MELREVIRRGPMTRFQWTVVVIAILLTVIDGYEILVTSFTLSSLTKYWNLSLSEQGLVASIGTLGMGIGAAALSPMADRIGRRKHILLSLIAIVAGMTLSGLAPSFTLFLIFRFLAGLFLGLAYVLTGELAIPIGLHITWNLFQGPVYGFPVSGTTARGAQVLVIEQGGPEAWTGGTFGVEGGLLCLLLTLLGSALIVGWVRWREGRVGWCVALAGSLGKSSRAK